MVYPSEKSGADRREFFRLNFSSPLQFKSYSARQSAPKSPSAAQSSSKGTSQNISQSGILFQTEKNPPQLSSLLWMDLDLRTLNICQEIERKALLLNRGLVGRVVRVEEDPENNRRYDVGVCFLTQDERDSAEVESLLYEISKTK